MHFLQLIGMFQTKGLGIASLYFDKRHRIAARLAYSQVTFFPPFLMASTGGKFLTYASFALTTDFKGFQPGADAGASNSSRIRSAVNFG